MGSQMGIGGRTSIKHFSPLSPELLVSFSFRRHIFRCMIMKRLYRGGVVCVYECQHADHLRRGVRLFFHKAVGSGFDHVRDLPDNSRLDHCG